MEKVKALPRICSSSRSNVRFLSCMGPKILSSKLMRVMLLHSVNSPSSVSLWCIVTSRRLSATFKIKVPKKERLLVLNLE